MFGFLFGGSIFSDPGRGGKKSFSKQKRVSFLVSCIKLHLKTPGDQIFPECLENFEYVISLQLNLGYTVIYSLCPKELWNSGKGYI